MTVAPPCHRGARARPGGHRRRRDVSPEEPVPCHPSTARCRRRRVSDRGVEDTPARRASSPKFLGDSGKLSRGWPIPEETLRTPGEETAARFRSQNIRGKRAKGKQQPLPDRPWPRAAGPCRHEDLSSPKFPTPLAPPTSPQAGRMRFALSGLNPTRRLAAKLVSLLPWPAGRPASPRADVSPASSQNHTEPLGKNSSDEERPPLLRGKEPSGRVETAAGPGQANAPAGPVSLAWGN